MDKYRVVHKEIALVMDSETKALIGVPVSDTLWRGESEPTEDDCRRIESHGKPTELQTRRIVRLGGISLPFGWRGPEQSEEESF